MVKKILLCVSILAIATELWVFRVAPGLGHILIWVLAFGITIHLKKTSEQASNPGLWMFLPALMFASSVTLYDASVVRFWGRILFLASLVWAIGWNLLRDRDFDDLSLLLPAKTLMPGPVLTQAYEGARSSTSWTQDQKKVYLQAFRGLLMAIPLLLVFGALLASADAVFDQTLGQLFTSFHLKPGPLLRLACTGFILLGWFHLWIRSPKSERPEPTTFFGSVEMSVALGCLNALFFFFLVIQAHYLFGGQAHVEAWDLSFADYARRGFFELSACIGLLLPLVMTAYRCAWVHHDSKLRYLAGGLVLAAGGLALSAFRRMLLYIEIYGLSIERFYAAAGILVALAVLGWAGWASLSPRPVSWVIARQTVTIIFLLGALSLVNVEARVADLNLSRNHQEQDLDLRYLGTLSSDVIPVLESHQDRFSPELNRELKQIASRIRGRTEQTGGAAWNLSRQRADTYPQRVSLAQP